MIRRIRRDAHAPRSGESRASSGARYRVGYGKPPKQHQFQPGQSGNRKGRPKGAKNKATLLREILDRKIEVRNGSTRPQNQRARGNTEPHRRGLP